METPIRLNGRGEVTIPFSKVGTPTPDLRAIFRAVGVFGASISAPPAPRHVGRAS